jgi:hypothetical protein
MGVGLWLHPRRPLLAGVVAVCAAAVGVERRAAARGLLWGPAPELAQVRALLPEDTATARPDGGCLVLASEPDRGRTIGRPRPRAGTTACPEPIGRGAFAPDAVPLIAVAPSAPATELLGWHRGGVGEVLALVRVGGGQAMPAWRVGARRIEAWGRLGDRRGAPLPGSVLAWSSGGQPLLAGAGGEIPVAGDLPQAAAAALAGRVRADLLVHPSAAPTVADLLALCREAAPEGRGIRCALVGGDPAAWLAVLAQPVPSEPAPAPTEVPVFYENEDGYYEDEDEPSSWSDG